MDGTRRRRSGPLDIGLSDRNKKVLILSFPLLMYLRALRPFKTQHEYGNWTISESFLWVNFFISALSLNTPTWSVALSCGYSPCSQCMNSHWVGPTQHLFTSNERVLSMERILLLLHMHSSSVVLNEFKLVKNPAIKEIKEGNKSQYKHLITYDGL